MKGFSTGMRLVGYLVSKNFRISMLNSWWGVSQKCYNCCLLGPSLKTFMPNIARNFEIYAPLCKETEGSHNIEKRSTATIKQTKGVISVIDENGKEHVMPMHEAERLAKRRSLKLLRMESTVLNKTKFRLVKSGEKSKENIQNTQKEGKRIILREKTHSHDIEVKIKNMLRFLEKGIKVSCIIEKSGRLDKMAEVLSILDKSGVKEYYQSKRETKTRVVLFYIPTEKKELPQEETKTDTETFETSH